MGSSNCRNWETDKVKNLIKSKRNGIYKKKEFHGRGVRIVNMGELFEYDFISDQKMELIELNEKEKNKFLLEDGDLLFARRSLVLEGSGKCSLVVNPKDDITFESSIIRLRPNKEIADPKFYFYYFSSPKGRSKVMSIASQTAVSGIRSSDLIELEVDVPPLNKQKQIASKLTSFDRLIKNNCRYIEILEEMARRIYREWFVHFRYPGHEDDELVDSELGEIPENWEVKSFSEIANFQNGKAFSSQHWQDEGLPIVKIRELKSGFSDNTSYYHGNDIKQKYHLYDGDLLFSWSASLGIFLWYRGHALLNQHIYNVSPKVDYLSKNYLYYALKISLKEFLTKTQGTTMQHIRKSALDEVKIALPPENIYQNFDNAIEPINDQILNLHKQNQNLKETRDLLLPKLISGKIDVEEIKYKLKEDALG